MTKSFSDRTINRLKKDKTLHSFTMIPNRVLYDGNLSPSAKSLYATLASFSEGWIIRKSHLVTLSSAGMSSLKSAWNELVKSGYMVVNQHRNEKGLYGGSVTTLFAEPMFLQADEELEPASNNDSNPKVENRPTDEKEGVKVVENDTVRDTDYPLAEKPTSDNQPLTILTSNNTKSLDNKKNKQKVLKDAFARFWEAYPKKVGKLAAEKAFAKALGETDIETLISGVNRYVEKIKKDCTEEKFQANPATWLNAGRWLDGNIENKYKNKKPELKERAGIDKKMCDIILKENGIPWFISWFENPNNYFSEKDGKLYLNVRNTFQFDRIVDECKGIINYLGFETVNENRLK